MAEEITRACRSGASTYTISPGHYRFNQRPGINHSDPERFTFTLKDLRRSDKNPFTIKAHGATFWFNLHDKPSPTPNYNMQFLNCENIVLEGATFDSDNPASIEGMVTEIDKDKNRIEIKLSVLSREISTKRINSGSGSRSKDYHKRIVPYNTKGRFISPTYYLDTVPGRWGPLHMKYTHVETSSKADHIWIYFKTNQLLKTGTSKKWADVYGADMAFKEGCYIAAAWSTATALSLNRSRQVTIKDCNIYLIGTQIGAMENGGYGGHKWINTKLIRRPGSGRLRGPDGFMFGNTKKGTTLDGVVVGHTFDDVLNIYANYGTVKKTNGNIIEMDDRSQAFRSHGEHGMPYDIRAGDSIELYDAQSRLKLETLKITALAGGNRIKVNKEVSVPPGTMVGFKDYECAGWHIKNCYFIDSYQRILIQTGPGILENNWIENMGAYLIIGANYEVWEGGDSYDIKIKDNLFANVAACSTYPAIKIHKGIHQGYKPGINISGNIIISPGNHAIEAHGVSNALINNNILVDPIRQTYLRNKESAGSKAILQSKSKSLNVNSNVLIERDAHTISESTTDKRIVNTDKNVSSTNNSYLSDPQNKLHKDIQKLLKTTRRTSSVISEIKKRVSKEIPEAEEVTSE